MKHIFSARTCIVFLFAASGIYAYPQNYTAGSDAGFEHFLSTLFQEEDFSGEKYADMYDMLVEMHDNPIDINSATVSQLSSLPFLSSQQIEDIQAYIYIYGNMKSLGELMMVGSLDYDTRRYLSYFVYAGEGKKEKDGLSLKDVAKYGRGLLLTRTEIPLYQRSGYAYHSPEELLRYPNRAYAGDAIKNNVKYTFSWHNIVRIGLSADKDPGEMWFQRQPLWMDFVSAYISLSDIGRIENLLIGNIRASFGQGLIVNDGFGMGKSTVYASIDRPMSGLRSSLSKSGYVTGAGSTLRFGHLSVSALVSYTGRDATLNESGQITSIVEDGYHRTASELSKRHNTKELLSLLHLNWHGNGIDVGSTFLSDNFDREFEKIPCRYGADGIFTSMMWNAGLDYSVRRTKFSIYGETALCDNLSIASINTFRLRLGRSGWLSLSYREYGSGYRALHSNSLTENDVSNERGLYLSSDFHIGDIEIYVYSDFAYFSAPTGKASLPSYCMDSQMMLTYAPRNAADAIDFRYRLKAKEQDCKSYGGLSYKDTGRARLRWTHTFMSGIELKSQLNAVHCYFPDTGFSKGFAIMEALSLKQDIHCLSGSVSLCYFDTDNYDTSISVYENGLQNAYNFLTLYGHGLRGSVVLRCRISAKASLMAKFGSTLYFDRESIGSSQQEIDNFHKEDISLQLRMKFQKNRRR